MAAATGGRRYAARGLRPPSEVADPLGLLKPQPLSSWLSLRHYLIYATASGAEVERLERHLSNEPSAHGLSAAYVSIPPEATRRLDPLKLRQVEVADRSQRVRRRAVGKARRQRIE